MKKLVLINLIISVFLVQCYTPFEFVKDQHFTELTRINDSPQKNESIKLSLSRDNYSSEDRSWNHKKASINPVLYYTPNQYGPEKGSKTPLRVILGMVIGGGIGWLAAPKVKLFNHTFAPDGLTYILVGASIGGIIGYFSGQDDE